jgi:hypothetical protein
MKLSRGRGERRGGHLGQRLTKGEPHKGNVDWWILSVWGNGRTPRAPRHHQDIANRFPRERQSEFINDEQKGDDAQLGQPPLMVCLDLMLFICFILLTARYKISFLIFGFVYLFSMTKLLKDSSKYPSPPSFHLLIKSSDRSPQRLSGRPGCRRDGLHSRNR